MSRTFIAQDDGLLLPTEIEDDATLPQALASGAVIDSKYKIISLLGQGGMGSVYLAHHLLLDKDMALKTFRSRKIDQEASKRFELEARAIAKLSHKNIIQVFDFGVTAEGRPFYTMELLSGTSLVKHIAQRSLSLRETLEIFREVADGLAHAHKAGIIHRDIKPDNIHLGAPGGKAGKISSVKIVDFGIAKLAMESLDNTAGRSSQSDQMLTKVGRVFGSPLYMSPEQSIGQPTDHRTDIYSFGCSLFEAITGRPPFVGETSRATLSCHRLDTPPTLAQCAPGKVFPQRLEALVARLLQKDKGDRFQSCVDIRQEITRILAILADGHVSEAETMAQKAETSLRPDNSRQAKTDPLIAADRAMTQILQANKKLILPAALVGLSALVAAFAWLAIINNWPGGDGHRNTLTPAPHLELARPALVPASPTAAGGRVAPPGKYLVRQTATSRIFNFPQGEPLGLLHFDKTEVAARGPVEIPKDSKCAFLATHPIALTPELLSGFGPDDLYEISFASTEEWKDRNMKWVGKLSGLRKIDLENCDLTAASIDYLNNLSRLRKICFNGIHIKAAQWCRFRPLATVADIKAEGLQDCSALVTKLKQKNSLERLELEGGDVSDATISGIACFKGLIRLKLVGNTVTSRGLKALLTLPKLNELVISKSRVGPDSMETLAALPALQELEIETGSWGLRNQRRLFDLMAAKKVRLKQTRPGRMMDP